MFISSAGYLGSMAFGALLLILIRKAVAARIVLLGCGIFIFALTMIYGLIKPIFWMNAWSGIPFTLLGRNGHLGGIGFNREVCQCASRDFLRELPGGAMRVECAL